MAEKKVIEVENLPFVTKASQEQEEKLVQASDTTIPGGRYIVNGQIVNANGEPIKG